MESYLSNRLMTVGSLNIKEYEDSMLLTDANLDKAL